MNMRKRFAAMLCCLLVNLYVQAQNKEYRIDSGSINGARFKVIFPASWNKQLVMYAHGYEFVGTPAGLDNNGFVASMQPFLDRGFAVGASAYRRQGWALPEGVEDTEALRRYFVRKYGQPDSTFMTGHSMGGGITLATIENHPQHYVGALPMCPLSSRPALQVQKEVDLIATFNALFPGMLGSLAEITDTSKPAVPIAALFQQAGALRDKIMADSARAAQFADRYYLKLQDLPFALLFGTQVLRDAVVKARGIPFDNTNTLYTGFGNDWELNHNVERIRKTAGALPIFEAYDRTGQLTRPSLLLHTTYDQLIPSPLAVSNYVEMVRKNKKEDLLVVQYTNGQGHCQFTPEETGKAFDALRNWVRQKQKPRPGALQ